MTGGYDDYDDGLFYWKLCDELSVVDAAILIIGENPSEQIDVFDAEEGVRRYNDDGSPKTKQRRDYANLQPVLKALRSAILSNRLRAKVSYPARGVYHYSPELSVMGEPVYHTVKLELGDSEEQTVVFDHLVSCKSAAALIHLGGPVEVARGADELWILKEPNWDQTTVAIDDLKAWLSERGLFPLFFFPSGVSDGFRDPSHPRYSAKLATAVAAWEKVDRAAKRKSVKQSLSEWVVSNGTQFGLGNSDGVVSQTAAEEVARIANWQTSGGATPTSVELDDDDTNEPMEIDNFEKIQPSKGDLDSDIPF